jgi:hypothetical protein
MNMHFQNSFSDVGFWHVEHEATCNWRGWNVGSQEGIAAVRSILVFAD